MTRPLSGPPQPAAGLTAAGLRDRVAQRVPGHSALWVVLATGINAVTTYGLLIVVARAVDKQLESEFLFFWALVMTAGLGVFLPVEQETARRVASWARGAAPAAIWRRSVRVALGIALGLVALGAIGWGSVGQPATAVAFGIAVLGYAVQFSARGVLSGHRRLGRYGFVAAFDSTARLVIAAVLAVAGVHRPGPYELAVGGAALLTGLLALALAGVAGSGVANSGVAGSGVTAGADPVPAAATGGLGRHAARLVLGAACMQALLNSGTVIAWLYATAAEKGIAAGLGLLLTMARVPVFVFQSLQATYLTRLADGAHRGDWAAVRRLLRLLGGIVAALVVVIILGGTALGPWVLSGFFGYPATRAGALLVSVSTAVYLAASVSNDASVAVGAHRRIALAWPLGLAVAVLTTLLAAGLTTKTALPLGLGAAAALLVLVPGIVNRSRPGAPPAPQSDDEVRAPVPLPE